MTEEAAGCNARSEHEGVLDDFDASGSVNQRDLESDLRILTARLPRDEFGRGGVDAAHLIGRQPFGRNRESFSALDLDDDDPRIIAKDQVYLATLPAPAAGCDLVAARYVVRLNLLFRDPAAMIRPRTRQLSTASFRAIW